MAGLLSPPGVVEHELKRSCRPASAFSQTAAQLAKLGFTLAPANAEEFTKIAEATAARWQQALAVVRRSPRP